MSLPQWLPPAGGFTSIPWAEGKWERRYNTLRRWLRLPLTARERERQGGIAIYGEPGNKPTDVVPAIYGGWQMSADPWKEYDAEYVQREHDAWRRVLYGDKPLDASKDEVETTPGLLSPKET